jgi:hypothetical protein
MKMTSSSKQKIVALLAGLTLLIEGTSYAAAPQPTIGKSCTKINQLYVASKATLKCVAINSHSAQWKLYVAPSSSARNISVAAPITPQTTVQTTGPAPTPPSSFEDLSTHISGLIFGSWAQASKKISTSSPNLGTIHYLIGPHTVANSGDAQYMNGITQVSKLYSDLPQVKNLYIIYFNRQDIDWAQSQFESYMDAYYGYGNRATMASDLCGQVCNGGMTFHTKSFDGIIMFATPDPAAITPQLAAAEVSGTDFAHEYTHTIQQMNMNPNWGGFPAWLTEGAATWSQSVAVNSANYSDYINFRNNVILGQQYAEPQTFTENWLTTFLNPSQTFAPGEQIDTYLRNYPHWDAYAVGMMVCEALVSLKGSDSLIALLQGINRGQSFAESFSATYGTSWQSAAPLLARAISLEISQKITQ